VLPNACSSHTTDLCTPYAVKYVRPISDHSTMTKTLHKLPEIRSSRTRPFDRKLLAVGYVRPLLLTTFDHLLNCPQLSSFAIFALGQFPSPRRRSRREIQFDVENAWHSLPLVSIISGPDESTLIQLRLFGIVGVTIHFFHFRKGSTGVGCGRTVDARERKCVSTKKREKS